MLKNLYIVNKLRLLKGVKLLKLFKHLKLANKINLILMCFLVSILISNTGLAMLLHQRAQQKVIYKELNALSQMMNVIGSFPYPPDRIFHYGGGGQVPSLTVNYDTTENSEIPERIFSNFISKVGYQNYEYQEIALNPNNSQADTFKTQLFERFIQGKANTYSAFRTSQKEKLFSIARCFPVQANNSTNSVCNQDQDKSTIVQVISVPASKVFLAPGKFWFLIVIIIMFNITVISILNLLLRITIAPLLRFSKVAQAVSTDNVDANFEQRHQAGFGQVYKDYKDYKDEIGIIVVSFNRMKDSLIIAKRLLDDLKKRQAQKKNNN